MSRGLNGCPQPRRHGFPVPGAEALNGRTDRRRANGSRLIQVAGADEGPIRLHHHLNPGYEDVWRKGGRVPGSLS